MKAEQQQRDRGVMSASVKDSLLEDKGQRNSISPYGSQETAALAVARHLNWRMGDSNGNGDLLPEPEDDSVLYMEQQGETLVVVGDVDLHQAPEFRDRAEAHIEETAQPRLDMSRVPFLDSAGLATLLALSRFAQARNKSLRLIVTGSPRRVLKITGIDRVLVLED